MSRTMLTARIEPTQSTLHCSTTCIVVDRASLLPQGEKALTWNHLQNKFLHIKSRFLHALLFATA